MNWVRLDQLMTDRPMPDGRRDLLHEEIRRHTLDLLDRRWQQLWGSFGVSVILLGFGGKLLLYRTDTHWPAALGLLFAGAVVWVLHRSVWQAWSQVVRHREDWLNLRDQALVTLGLWTAVLAPGDAGWWPLPLLLGSFYGVWRLQLNARQHWRSWFFRLARTLLKRPPQT